MVAILPDVIKREVEQQGYAIMGNIGGQPKTHYWTPDGRELWVAPSWHEFAIRNTKGKVTEQGVRDANLDNGWLTTKPKKLQLYCPHCDKWHETLSGITICQEKRQTFIKHSTAKMQKLEQGDINEERINQLETDINEIKNLLLKLIGDK